MFLAAKAKKARLLLKHKGILYVARFVFRRVVLERVARVVYDLDTSCLPPAPSWDPEESLEVYGLARRRDIPQALVESAGGEFAQEYLQGLEQGDLLFAVRSGGQYLHSSFVLIKGRQPAFLRLPAGVPVIANCNTLPEARGRGLYPKTLRAAVRHLAAMGFQRIGIETALSNTASQRGIEKAGFRRLHTMSGAVLFGKIAIQRICSEQGHRWHIWLP